MAFDSTLPRPGRNLLTPADQLLEIVLLRDRISIGSLSFGRVSWVRSARSLESGVAKPLLGPLIRGKTMGISEDDQKLIAFWTAKTTMMLGSSKLGCLVKVEWFVLADAPGFTDDAY